MQVSNADRMNIINEFFLALRPYIYRESQGWIFYREEGVQLNTPTAVGIIDVEQKHAVAVDGLLGFGGSTDLIYSNLRVDRFDPTSAPFRDGAAEEALCPASKLWGCGSGTECWGGVVPSPSYSGRGVPRRCAQLSSPEWIPSDLAVAAFVLRGGAVAVDLRHAVVSLPRSHCLRPHARVDLQASMTGTGGGSQTPNWKKWNCTKEKKRH
ncbi:hypothetical protein U9M48_025984 [Paspalum notatum var. saurae]|uniref:Uncharacterized protein n=1 Tax=Paspalum notatum var. saurae TaxID=547442 RepID=A0AAQ3TRA4_PASNO